MRIRIPLIYMITGLFMGWTDPISKQWFPIKKMTWNDGKYYTVYLQGMRSAIAVNPSKGTAVRAGLIKLEDVNISNELEVSFRTRMPVNRPFTDVEELDRMGLSTDLIQFDPLEYTARSGGGVGGDTSDLFPEVTPDNHGTYHFHFGIGAIDELDITKYIRDLQLGSRLTIKNGLIYHESSLLGQAPGYIADLAKHHPQAIDLVVDKINHDIYKFGKLLCHVRVDSLVVIPFSDRDYQPLVDIFAASK
jgi:hypothetical protein